MDHHHQQNAGSGGSSSRSPRRMRRRGGPGGGIEGSDQQQQQQQHQQQHHAPNPPFRGAGGVVGPQQLRPQQNDNPFQIGGGGVQNNVGGGRFRGGGGAGAGPQHVIGGGSAAYMEESPVRHQQQQQQPQHYGAAEYAPYHQQPGHQFRGVGPQQQQLDGSFRGDGGGGNPFGGAGQYQGGGGIGGAGGALAPAGEYGGGGGGMGVNMGMGGPGPGPPQPQPPPPAPRNYPQVPQGQYVPMDVVHPSPGGRGLGGDGGVAYHQHQPSPQRQPQQQQMLMQQQQQQQMMMQQHQQRAVHGGGGGGGMVVAHQRGPQHPMGAEVVEVVGGPGGGAIVPVPEHRPRRRDAAERPIVRLSVSLIDTYKTINTKYYEEREARRAVRKQEAEAVAAAAASGGSSSKDVGGAGAAGGGEGGGGDDVSASSHRNHQKQKASAAVTAASSAAAHHPEWDDENYDYKITENELIGDGDRYCVRERIGRGSFGQVVRARDNVARRDVAIKIIKSRKPFHVQAQTEIELLSSLCRMDPDDQYNIVRLESSFIFKNHQCLVFEMLSLNLYELLRNTQFGGVSLNLIRKFAKQILKALMFLARPDVNIIHCDLKPENILLRHPKRSSIKLVDFGSSCRSNRQTYSYIQSRFYRSPEVMLGLPYSVAIDMWSLGCILVEMHTGEPLFSGSDQFDQMQKIIEVLGMVPTRMIERSSGKHRDIFFERSDHRGNQWVMKQVSSSSGSMAVPSIDPLVSLKNKVRAETSRRRQYQDSQHTYEVFEDLILRMLAYDPQDRIRPLDALRHPFITDPDERVHQHHGNEGKRDQQSSQHRNSTAK